MNIVMIEFIPDEVRIEIGDSIIPSYMIKPSNENYRLELTDEKYIELKQRIYELIQSKKGK